MNDSPEKVRQYGKFLRRKVNVKNVRKSISHNAYLALSHSFFSTFSQSKQIQNEKRWKSNLTKLLPIWYDGCRSLYLSPPRKKMKDNKKK